MTAGILKLSGQARQARWQLRIEILLTCHVYLSSPLSQTHCNSVSTSIKLLFWNLKTLMSIYLQWQCKHEHWADWTGVSSQGGNTQWYTIIALHNGLVNWVHIGFVVVVCLFVFLEFSLATLLVLGKQNKTICRSTCVLQRRLKPITISNFMRL